MAGPHSQCMSSYWVVNMLVRLSVCTREEQRSVIRFLWAEGVKGAEIHACLCTQHRNNTLPRRSIYEWIEMFENGRTSVMDAERLGRPWTSTTNEKLEEHYMEKGVAVTSVNCSNMLRNELRMAVRSKRRGRLTQGVLLLHDNARPHTAHLTINTIL